MRYKVGDRVVVDPKAYQKPWSEACTFVYKMEEYLGQIIEITRVDDNYDVPIYKDTNGWWWVENVLHPVSRPQDFAPIDIFKHK